MEREGSSAENNLQLMLLAQHAGDGQSTEALNECCASPSTLTCEEGAEGFARIDQQVAPLLS